MKKFLLAMAMLAASSAGIVAPAHSEGHSPTRIQQPRPASWMEEEWTGDSVVYARIQTEIDSALAEQKNPSVFFEKLQEESAKNPSDATDQFRWAYAAYQGTQLKISGAEAELAQAIPPLFSAPSPHVPQWTRLKFLAAVRAFPDASLKKVGLRLVENKPDDYDVKYRLIATLNPGGSESERQEALTYAGDLVRIAPRRASAYSALAGVYYRAWLLNKNKNDATQAIATYQRYLQLAPEKESFRSQVPNLIALMNGALKKH